MQNKSFLSHSISRLLLPGILILLFVLMSCAPTTALKKPPEHSKSVLAFRDAIDRVLEDSLLRQTRTGIKIVSMTNGEILYARNNQQLFHPASNMKLLTTATALKRLGTNFKFKTRLLNDSIALQDSSIAGDLYLKGFGDPELTTADLHRMVMELKDRGIRRISGNIICDDSYMDDLYWGTGWMWDDVSSEDFAAISALTVNDNCVVVRVKPGAKPGDSLIVSLEPPTAYVKIENLGITINSLDTLKRKAFKVERKWKKPENTIMVRGGLYAGEEERIYKIDILGAELYTGTLLKELLEEEKIIVDGRVEKGAAPDTSVVLAEHYSDPLALIIYRTNKISDNLSAELIMKTLGAEIIGPPGTAKKGLSVIRRFIAETGVDSSTYKLADGSGVSRYNVITPDLIIQLLKAMHKDFGIQAEFKSSLPIAGVDGTLQRRMKDSPAEKMLRAKTGTLRGVSALSGYTATADGEIVAFSMIMEHFVMSASKIRKVQDKIGELITSFSRKPGVATGSNIKND